MEEREAFCRHGFYGVAVMVIAAGVAAVNALASVSFFVAGSLVTGSVLVFVATLAVVVALISINGFLIIQPNIAYVLVFFGRYVGTVKRNGWFWVNPLTKSEKVSLRIENFDSQSLKVNDAVGNPVEITAVIVWKVDNAAAALFDVIDYEVFVKVQTEAAIRHVASLYPYDNYEDDQKSLRANAEEVTADLQKELQEHLKKAGIEVINSQLTRLSYATEIASDMLRRQQASAVVAARRLIVEGAVGMVSDALELLSTHKIVELDEERKAQMVSNLLVVLCGEGHAQPIINAGSLHQ